MSDLMVILHNIFRKKSRESSKIAIHDFKEIKFIDQSEIVYCKAEGRYTRIYLRNKKYIYEVRLLRKVESILSKNNFFRIHRSYLVNINYITGIINKKILILEHNIQLPIARRRKNKLREKISKNL